MYIHLQTSKYSDTGSSDINYFPNSIKAFGLPMKDGIVLLPNVSQSTISTPSTSSTPSFAPSKFESFTIWILNPGRIIYRKISDHIFRSSNTSTKRLVVDGFCGLGGNVIQFALSPQCSKVIAIDNDAAMLACARRNAQIYGVEHKIEFIEIDFFEYTRKRTDSQPDVPVDYVFLSPPWGGPSYRHDEIFDLEKMEPHSG